MGIKNRLYKHCFPEFISAAAIRRRSPHSGIVLMYHEVFRDKIKIPAWTVVKESNFRWQMNYMRKYFNIISMDEALERIQGRHQGEKPFAVITFDDGYKGNLDNVLPVMESMGLPFIVYVSTQAVIDSRLLWFDRIISLLGHSEDVHVKLKTDQLAENFTIPGRAPETERWHEVQKLLESLKRMTPDERSFWVERITEQHERIETKLEMLSIDDLKDLASSDLVTIGSHTHGHELLDQLNDLSINTTLQTSIHNIMDFTGVKPKHFSYPNGNYNQRVVALVQMMGFITAVTTDSGLFSMKNGFFEIPRIGIGRFETKRQFMARVSGFLM